MPRRVVTWGDTPRCIQTSLTSLFFLSLRPHYLQSLIIGSACFDELALYLCADTLSSPIDIMKIGYIEAEILIEGQAAKEYTDVKFEQDPVEGTMYKYIEAVPGAGFAFRVKVNPGYEFAPAIDYLSIKFLVDGRTTGTRQCVDKENFFNWQPKTIIRSGYITTATARWTQEKFRFSALDTYRFVIWPGCTLCYLTDTYLRWPDSGCSSQSSEARVCAGWRTASQCA